MRDRINHKYSKDDNEGVCSVVELLVEVPRAPELRKSPLSVSLQFLQYGENESHGRITYEYC